MPKVVAAAIDLEDPDFQGVLRYLTDPMWREALRSEVRKPYFKKLVAELEVMYAGTKQVFPPKEQVFTAFNVTPFDSMKAVIIGQDPYHDDGQAMGLCFSVPKRIKTPPSLIRIYKELETDIPGFKAPKHGCLEAWTHQGVFLLNATLTVFAHTPNSHVNLGWTTFTDAVIRHINTHKSNVVFLLWGGFAHKKASVCVSPLSFSLLLFLSLSVSLLVLVMVMVMIGKIVVLVREAEDDDTLVVLLSGRSCSFALALHLAVGPS